jgi:hypothetical protein
MKRTTRNALAVALVAAVAFGVSAPAAIAAPKDKPAHVKTQAKGQEKGKATADTKKAAAQEKKAAGQAKRQAAQERQLLRLIDSRDARLARVVEGDLLTDDLPQEVVDAVTSNVATDRQVLAVIREAVAAGGQDLRQVRTELRTFRVETYNVVVGVVREAAEITEEAAANDAALAELDPTDPAVAEAQAANDDAVLAAQDAVAKALLLTATSPVQDRGAAEADLETARELLEQVAAFLATQEPVFEEAPAEEF